MPSGESEEGAPAGGSVNPRRVTIEPVLFLYMLALYIAAPANQQMTYLKYCRIKFAENVAVCDNATLTGNDADLQTQTAHLTMYSAVCVTLPMIATCTFLGSWSDRYSRKWPQLVPLLGGALASGGSLLLAIQIDWHPAWYVVTGVIQGLSGYFAGVLLTTLSYLTSLVPEDKVTIRVAAAEAVSSLGLLAGSLASGVILDKLGLVWVYVVVTSVYAAAAAYVVLLVPQLRANADAKESVKGNLFSFATVSDYVRCVLKKRRGFERMYLHLSLASFYFGFCTVAGTTQLLFLFLTKVHGFTTTLYGFYNGLDILLKVVVGSAVLVVLKRCFRWSELSIAMLGCAASVFGYGVVAVAQATWMLWLGPVVNSLGFFYAVALRGYVSKLVPKDEQGRIFAFMATGQSVFTFISSVVFNALYPVSLGFYPGLCFAVAATLSVVALALVAVLSAHTYRHTPPMAELLSETDH